MNAQIGINDSAAIAQNGIFARDLAAATYGGSGFGGGASAGAAAGLATDRAGGRRRLPECRRGRRRRGRGGIRRTRRAGFRRRRGLATAEPQCRSAVSRALEEMFGDLSHGDANDRRNRSVSGKPSNALRSGEARSRTLDTIVPQNAV